MRVVKSRLRELMPDLHVFLDVDDLEEIGDLEGYIERSSTVLIYCTDGYCRSRNCMREIIASTKQLKPVIATIDPDISHGGLSIEEMLNRLQAAEGKYESWGFDMLSTPTGQQLHDHLFAQEVIEWNRT